MVSKKQKQHSGSFKKGREKTGGRQRGQTNKMPVLLRHAIIEAAKAEGLNQHGKEGLIGFLRHVAREDIRGFAMLLSRVLPVEFDAAQDVAVEVTYRSVDEVRRELESRGIDIHAVARLLHRPAEVIDHDATEMVDADTVTNGRG